MSESGINEYLQLTIELAREGGALAAKSLGKTHTSIKSDNSPVTEADRNVQDLIVGRLLEQVPEHGIIAEEETELTDKLKKSNAEYVWVIDPIDGTRNFASGIKIFCCSVALLRNGRPITGAVYEPNSDWMFSASVESSAMLNDAIISVSKDDFNPRTTLAYSVDKYQAIPERLLKMFERCIFRNFGSAALHLGMVASGMMDGVMSFSGKLWDVAAGGLIVKRAGGSVEPMDPEQEAIWPVDMEKYKDESLVLCAGNSGILEHIRA